ncbi:hypothetical protein NLY39_11400 [Pseudomonas sp. KHPS1]|nr:hypothetical protein [Pseudomonas sp. KHPS1]UTH38707.1 hypothetical protein NLY39_11400 [Pseudomonas sp. KHPS1]
MSEEFGFTFCSILHRQKIYVAGIAVELEDQDVHHAILFELQDDDWDRWSFEHRLAGIASYQTNDVAKLITVGIDGFVEIADFDGADEERIGEHEADGGPSLLRPLRCVRIIGDHVYVAGARRQVYRRRLSGTDWRRYDQGVYIPRSSLESGSLHDIDGNGENWLIAVGLGGEIWTCTDGIWSQLDSPTNIRLEAVRHLGGTDFIAAGAQGTIIIGNANTLRILEQDLTTETFSSIEKAFGGIYLCTDQGNLFRIDNSVLSSINTILPPSPGGGFLSYGDQHLIFSTDFNVIIFDGANWKEISPT